MTRNYDRAMQIEKQLIQRDVAAESPVGNLNKRVPAAVNTYSIDYLLDGYFASQEDVALLAQQRLAKALLKLMYPTADGRLRVSKRKLAILFDKIGVSV